jgi:hypothetical protein
MNNALVTLVTSLLPPHATSRHDAGCCDVGTGGLGKSLNKWRTSHRRNAWFWAVF